MVEEFGLHRRHVDVHRAVVGAPFTREAEIEGVVNLRAAPTIGDDLALQHLEEKSGTPSCRMRFLLGRDIARTHHVGAVGKTTLADADAPKRRVSEVTLVLSIREIGARSPRV